MKIKLYGALKDLTEEPEIELLIDDESTIEDVIKKLIDRYGLEFKRIVSDYSTGITSPDKTFFILVNGINIDSLKNPWSFKLSPNDEVTLLPIVEGG